MQHQIEPGQMVFTREGADGIGAVRTVEGHSFKIHVENAGEFTIALTSVTSVHDGKVIVDPQKLDADLQAAVAHRHDREDPDLVG